MDSKKKKSDEAGKSEKDKYRILFSILTSNEEYDVKCTTEIPEYIGRGNVLGGCGRRGDVWICDADM